MRGKNKWGEIGRHSVGLGSTRKKTTQEVKQKKYKKIMELGRKVSLEM